MSEISTKAIHKPVKVLIIDDSLVVRGILSKELDRFDDLEVVGTAGDVYEARDKIVQLNPDVMTLDIEMPRMSGVEFLKRLMPQYPLPTIIISSFGSKGTKESLEALEYGAIDVIQKPSRKIGMGMSAVINDIKDKILSASKVNVSHWAKKDKSEIAVSAEIVQANYDPLRSMIAIGSSTGGTLAIGKILKQFPLNMPPTLIVQHMPSRFTKQFAERLDKEVKVRVKEAETGDRLASGQVLIAPGDKHMEVHRFHDSLGVRCYEGEKVGGHRPAVSVLFSSLVDLCDTKKVISVMLTGMGKDGAIEMKDLKDRGAETLAQDEASSVVWGMPRAAWELGGVQSLLPLNGIVPKIISIIQ